MSTQLGSDHQAQQEALVGLIPSLTREAWPLLDVHNIQGTLPRLLAAVEALVRRYGRASAVGALDYYKSERAAAKVPGRPTLKLADPTPPKVVESAVQWAVSDLYGPVSPESEAKALGKVDAAVERLVLNESRDTIIGAVQSDREAKGWARVPEPGACSFCAMLATRGAVYSKESVSFEAHNHCRCHVEPVFHHYEPSAQIREWQGIYNRLKADYGGGRDMRVAFRQALEGRPVTGPTVKAYHHQ